MPLGCQGGKKDIIVMKIITKQNLINGFAELYKQQYCIRHGDNLASFGLKLSHNEHYEMLRNSSTEDEIEKIIGNRSWTRNKCDECQKDQETTVLLGEEPDYESATAQICLECLKKAVALLKSQ